MKQRLVEHIVQTTTRRSALLLLVALVLCGLSGLAAAYLLESDLTFKGMIGASAPPVRAYDRVIREFEVSGVITVAIEPRPAVERRVGTIRGQVDRLVLGLLDRSARDRLLGALNPPDGQVADLTLDLSARDRLLCLLDLLRLLGPTARASALPSGGRLSAEDRALLLGQADATDPQTRRTLLRKLEKLDPPARAALAARARSLPSTKRDDLVSTIATRMSIYDKKTLIEEVAGIAADRRTAALTRVDALDTELAAVLDDFRRRALAFAADLRLALASAEPVDGLPEPPRSVVRGVLYSEELSISADGLMVLALVSPARDIDQMHNARQFCATLDAVIGRLEGKGAHRELRVRRTGFAAAQVDARNAMFEDFGVMMAVTVAGILLVFLFGLRSLDFPLLAMVPMGVGVALMFGIYALFGQLNLVSMMTPIILFGLGIDYAIHLGARYGELRLELGPNVPQEDLLRRTLQSVGGGMLVASVTTVFAFLSLLASTISGLAQSGLMAAAGVVASFVAMVYIMPILITWRERLAGTRRARFLRAGRYVRLGRLADSRAGRAIALALIALALSAVYFVPRIRLERDGMKLSPDGLESITLSKDLEARFGYTDAQAYFILDGYDTLAAFRRELAREEGGASAYPAINTMRVLDARKAIRTFEKLGWDRDVNTLDRYVARYAARPNLMGEMSEHIAEVYGFIARHYVNWEAESFLVIVPPSGYVWDRDLTELFVADLGRLEAKFGIKSAGFVQIWKFLVDHLLGDLIASTAVAFALVLLALLALSRSVRATLVCSLSLLVALAGTLAVIGALGLELTCVNIIAFPIIIGLGIDYIVHIYYRLVREEALDVVGAVASTGKAVLLTTATTLVAFGAISFSAHKGLAMMGRFALIGLCVCLLTSLFLVPAAVSLVHGHRAPDRAASQRRPT